MIKILICDDDKNFLNIVETCLKNFILSEYPELEYTVFSTNSSEKALEYSLENLPEIVLLDIDIPGLNGFDIATALKEKFIDAKIIFISNLEQFVYTSFKFNAFRFIRKTHIETELKEAIKSAIKEIDIDNGFLQLSVKEGYMKLMYSQIAFIESKGNYVEINTIDGKKFSHIATLKSVYEELQNYDFVRIHSGFLVSMKNIKFLHKEDIEMQNGILLKISRKNVKEVQKKYNEYLRR